MNKKLHLLYKFMINIIAAAVLSACTNMSQPNLQEPLKNERPIIITTKNNAEYSLNNLNYMAIPFMVSKLAYEDEFLQIIQDSQFNFDQQLTAHLHESFVEAGYEVLEKSGNSNISDKYSLEIETKHIGYHAGAITTGDGDYRPFVNTLTAVLTDPTGKTVYGESILYGFENPLINATELPAPRACFFSSYNHLIRSGKAVECLSYMTIDIANYIARKLVGRHHINKTNKKITQYREPNFKTAEPTHSPTKKEPYNPSRSRETTNRKSSIDAAACDREYSHLFSICEY